jgi:hypothetical protein
MAWLITRTAQLLAVLLLIALLVGTPEKPAPTAMHLQGDRIWLNVHN